MHPLDSTDGVFSDDRVTAPWFTLEVMDSVCGVCVCVCICLATSSATLQETRKALYQPCPRVLLQLAGLGFALCHSHTHSHTVDQGIPGGLPPCEHQNSLHYGDPHMGSWGPQRCPVVIGKPLGDSLLNSAQHVGPLRISCSPRSQLYFQLPLLPRLGLQLLPLLSFLCCSLCLGYPTLLRLLS